MNCRNARSWISAELDGELSPRRRAALEAHLASCAECRAAKEQWAMAGARLRERVESVKPPLTAEQTWHEVRRRIRNQAPEPEAVPGFVFGPAFRWAIATIALVAVFGLGVFGLRARHPAGAAMAAKTDVEWVETGLPDASTMVYEDAESGCTVIWVVEEDSKKGAPHAGT